MKLTKQQARKLMKGGSVQLKPEQLGLNLPMDFPLTIQKQIERAMRQGRGMRLKFGPEHLVQGSGIMDWLKSAASTVGSVLKPIAQVAAPLAKVFAPTIAAKTGLSTDVISGLADVGSQLAGKGMRGGAVLKGRQYKLADDYSTMMNPQHPVFGFQPQLPPPGDLTKALHPKQGEPTKMGGGVMFDSKQFTNPFVPVQRNLTAGAGAGGSFKLSGKGMMKRGGSFRMN